MMRKCTAHSLSLHDLAQHGLIEHDASLVHDDTAPGHKFAPIRCDTKLLNKLLDSDVLTLNKVAKRREELERTAPLDLLHQEVARGEWALVLDIFGRENGGNCPSDLLRVWLKQNQFPEGWKPGHEQSLPATMSEAGEIRSEMKKFHMMA
jgi:Peroxidase, family 2